MPLVCSRLLIVGVCATLVAGCSADGNMSTSGGGGTGGGSTGGGGSNNATTVTITFVGPSIPSLVVA